MMLNKLQGGRKVLDFYYKFYDNFPRGRVLFKKLDFCLECSGYVPFADFRRDISPRTNRNGATDDRSKLLHQSTGGFSQWGGVSGDFLGRISGKFTFPGFEATKSRCKKLL